MAIWPFRGATFERTVWTVVVWFLFGLFVLGPLATVFAFSFTSSVLSGHGTFTLTWYAQLFSQPGLYGPLIRSFEIAVIVVVFQLMFGTIIAYSTVREKVFGATIIVVSAVLKTAPIAIFTQAEAGSLELASAYSVVLMVVSFVAYLLMSRWLLRGA